MQKSLLGAVAVLALATPVLADGMANAVGHTVRVTSAEGSFDASFSADGSYSDTRGITGTWTIGDQLCLTVQTEEGPNTSCGPWNETLAPGEVWTTDGWGQSMTVEIVE